MKFAFVISNKNEINFTHYNNQEFGRAKRIVEMGHNVDVFVRSKVANGSKVLYTDNNAECNLIYYKGVDFLGNQTIPIDLFKFLNGSYDCAIIHEYPWLISFQVAKYLKKRKVRVFLMQGVYENFGGKFKCLYNIIFDFFFFKGLLKNLDGIIFKTLSSKLYFDKKGLPLPSHEIIPVGLDLDLFDRGRNALMDNSLITEFESKSQFSYLNLLYIGKLEKRRNPLFLLELIKQLNSFSEKKYTLTIIGSGPLQREVVQSIKIGKIEDYVIYIPSLSQNEIKWYYERSDLFLLPSSYEIFGMVLLEALYFNLQIISTPTAGSIDILTECPFSHVIELEIDKWLEVIRKTKPLSECEKAEIALYFNQNYDWNNICDRILKFIKK